MWHDYNYDDDYYDWEIQERLDEGTLTFKESPNYTDEEKKWISEEMKKSDYERRHPLPYC